MLIIHCILAKQHQPAAILRNKLKIIALQKSEKSMRLKVAKAGHPLSH